MRISSPHFDPIASTLTHRSLPVFTRPSRNTPVNRQQAREGCTACHRPPRGPLPAPNPPPAPPTRPHPPCRRRASGSDGSIGCRSANPISESPVRSCRDLLPTVGRLQMADRPGGCGPGRSKTPCRVVYCSAGLVPVRACRSGDAPIQQARAALAANDPGSVGARQCPCHRAPVAPSGPALWLASLPRRSPTPRRGCVRVFALLPGLLCCADWRPSGLRGRSPPQLSSVT